MTDNIVFVGLNKKLSQEIERVFFVNLIVYWSFGINKYPLSSPVEDELSLR